MKMGRVIGTVVATHKEPTLEGLKLLVVQGIDLDNQTHGPIVVAADAVGAGVGEVVLYASGSAARQTQITVNCPVDAVIMAIVDQFTSDGAVRYIKE